MNILFPVVRFTDVSAVLAPFVKNMALMFKANIHVLRVEPLIDQFIEMRVVAGRQRQQRDLVVAGLLVRLDRRPNNRLDATEPQRPLGRRALAEAAAAGAPGKKDRA